MTVRMVPPAAADSDLNGSSATVEGTPPTEPESAMVQAWRPRAPEATGLNRSSSPAAPLPSNAAESAESTARAKAAPVAPGLPSAPNYLVGASLDPGPKPLHEIEPAYPARAGQQQGLVVLRLLINERGLVDNAAVVRSEPRGFFEESALEAFTSARFSPGLLFGLPVKSQVTIEVEFMPINRGAGVSGRTY